MNDRTLLRVITGFLALLLIIAGWKYFDRQYSAKKKRQIFNERQRENWRPTLRTLNDGDVSVRQ